VISFSRNSTALIGPAAAAPESDIAAAPGPARSAVVPVCYLLAAVLLTWRLWGNPASRMVTGNSDDTDLFAWYMRYAATALQHGHLPALVTTGMNAPTGINMMWNTPMLLVGIVLAPVTWLAGPQVSLTIMTTVGFAGSAAALFWVLRRWNVSVAAAALAGAVYGFSPAILQTTLAHYDMELAFLPPLIIHAGLRVTLGPPARSSWSAGPPVRWPGRWLARLPAWAPAGVWLGLLVAAQMFISEEVTLTAALAGVLVVLVLAVSRPTAVIRRVKATAAGLLVAAVVALALTASALWTQFRGPLTEHGSSYSPEKYANALANFVTPQGALLFHTAASAATAARYQGGLPEYLGYLGWPLLAVLALAAVVSWRRLAGRAACVAFVVLTVFSLGGRLFINISSHPGAYLPWHWIERISVLGQVLPARLSILADGCAAVLLAVGIDEARARLTARRESWRPPARLAPAAVVAVAVLCCLPLLPRPLPASRTSPLPAGWSAIFAQLNLGPGSRVLILPISRSGVTLSLRWEADSGQSLATIGGYFLGPGTGGRARLDGLEPNRKIQYFNYLWAQGVPPGSPYHRTAAVALGQWLWSASPEEGRPPTPNNWPVVHPMAALAQLAIWRPQAVIADATANSPLGQYLAKVLGPPMVTVDDLIGWRLSAVPNSVYAQPSQQPHRRSARRADVHAGHPEAAAVTAAEIHKAAGA
jgi:hypothetical protein